MKEAETLTIWDGLAEALAAGGLSTEAAARLKAAVAHVDRVTPHVRLGLETFINQAPEPESLVRLLIERPRTLDALLTLFDQSRFLGDALLRQQALFPGLAEEVFAREVKGGAQMRDDALAVVRAHQTFERQRDALRRYQRHELLRIGMADVLGLAELTQVTESLSALAEALTEAGLYMAAGQSAEVSAEGFCVIAMGKLGGHELNYSSDIDLLFICAENPSRFESLGRDLIQGLSAVTAEGFLYRVDMRLRPWGSAGALVTSRAGHLSYLRNHARLWEKQAMLKARPIAGDLALGRAFVADARQTLFSEAPERVREEVRQMKRRIEQQLVRQGIHWGEVKLGVGSIRDIEFVTQYLQLLHGAEYPSMVTANTLDALYRLWNGGLLPLDHYRILADGYVFLRTGEHYLQLADNRQTHQLPSDPQALARFAHKLGFVGEEAGEQFAARYEQHTRAIRAVYSWYLESEIPPMTTNPDGQQPDQRLQAHIERMAPDYAQVFDAAQIRHHAALAHRLHRDHLLEVETEPSDDGSWQVTIVAYDYVGVLSLICGLFHVHGLNVISGQAFTYEESAQEEPRPRSGPGRYRREDERRKIVDVFRVRPVEGSVSDTLWRTYRTELEELIALVRDREMRQAQGRLARQVARMASARAAAEQSLPPMSIVVESSEDNQYTVLEIDALDTPGFLYEFTNALTLNDANVVRVVVDSVGNRVQDTFFLLDRWGRKIDTPEKQRALRASTALVKHFTHLLPQSPNPEAAQLHFREFLAQLFKRPDWPDELVSLERPEVLSALARLLGVSEFLWDDFLRMQYENLFPVVRDVDELARPRLKSELALELQSALDSAADFEAQRLALNAFKDRESFRVDLRHIQGHLPSFSQFSEELSDVAEVVVQGAWRICTAELGAEHGHPPGNGVEPASLAIFALGKLGGREIGYASDIELMFIYAGDGMTSGPLPLTVAAYYEKLVQRFLETIRAKREGIFEIDLRLRPYGTAGSLAVSLAAFESYFGPDGSAWPYERQALTRLRYLCGDVALGQRVGALRDAQIYNGRPFDVGAMRAMRERQLRHLVTPGTLNAKFSQGGLVDAEYLVQALQIQYGTEHPQVRQPNTQQAMAALYQIGALSQTDYERLAAGHAFLRNLIDALRMVRGNAKDLTVPQRPSEAFDFLARRLGYGADGQRLWDDIQHHVGQVQSLSIELLRSG